MLMSFALQKGPEERAGLVVRKRVEPQAAHTHIKYDSVHRNVVYHLLFGENTVMQADIPVWEPFGCKGCLKGLALQVPWELVNMFGI